MAYFLEILVCLVCGLETDRAELDKPDANENWCPACKAEGKDSPLILKDDPSRDLVRL